MFEAEEVQIVLVGQLVFFCLHDRICLCTKMAALTNNYHTRTRIPTSARPATARKSPSTQTRRIVDPTSTSVVGGLRATRKRRKATTTMGCPASTGPVDVGSQ